MTTATPSRPSENSGAAPVAKPPHERADRREFVRRLLDQNLPTGEIVVRCQERWQVSRPTISADIRRVERERRDDPSLDELRRECVRTHRRIRSRALSEGDLSAARLANRDLARWAGLEAGDVHVHLGGQDPSRQALEPTVAPLRALAFDAESRAALEVLVTHLQGRVIDVKAEAVSGGAA